MSYRVLGEVGIYTVLWDPSGKTIVNRSKIIGSETVKVFSERMRDPTFALQFASKWIRENRG